MVGLKDINRFLGLENVHGPREAVALELLSTPRSHGGSPAPPLLNNTSLYSKGTTIFRYRTRGWLASLGGGVSLVVLNSHYHACL